MTIAMAGFVLGAVVALRFSVAILFPTIVAAAAAIVAAGIFFRLGAVASIVMIVTTATALQLGYLAGCLGRVTVNKLWLEFGTAKVAEAPGHPQQRRTRSRSQLA